MGIVCSTNGNGGNFGKMNNEAKVNFIFLVLFGVLCVILIGVTK